MWEFPGRQWRFPLFPGKLDRMAPRHPAPTAPLPPGDKGLYTWRMPCSSPCPHLTDPLPTVILCLAGRHFTVGRFSQGGQSGEQGEQGRLAGRDLVMTWALDWEQTPASHYSTGLGWPAAASTKAGLLCCVPCGGSLTVDREMRHCCVFMPCEKKAE